MKPQQNYPQITTDETLRETVQHGLENFLSAIIWKMSGILIFTALTGTGIMTWNLSM